MVLLDIIAHHLSLLKLCMASKAGSSSREGSGDIQKPLPNQQTEYERRQGMAELQILLFVFVPFLISPGMYTFRGVALPQRWIMPCQLNWLQNSSGKTSHCSFNF